MIIRVHVKARARRRSIVKKEDGTYRIETTEAPESGKANDDVVDIVAEHFSVAKSCVQLKKGHTSPRKIIEIMA